jgi:UDP-N-acetylmuramate--alanine ligase
MFSKKHIHFVGIGGIGMSAIAQVLYQKGFKVTGSDISENLITKKLKKKIKIFYSHKPGNVNNADILVHSSAINKNNVEIKCASKKKIPIFSRAMMLAEIMRLKPSITVAGSHGKTTTTSIIASILEFSGYDPTILSGGIINGLEINAKLGKGQWIVAEADESDGSFVFLPSTIGIINNIDFEHVDYYKNIKDLKNSFLKYIHNIPFYGLVALGIDNKNVKEIKEKIHGKKIVTFGLSNDADFRAINIKTLKRNEGFFTSFDIVDKFQKKMTKNFIVPLIGEHNIRNILASISVTRGLKIPYTKIKQSLRNFKGVKRRFTILYKKNENLIIDDYAHHPVEINSTLSSLKLITKKKIITVFEPHRYSRLSEMFEQFLYSLRYSDEIFVLPVYTAGEKKINKIDSIYFFNKLRKKYKNKFIYLSSDIKKTFMILKKNISPGDNVIFLGAGMSSKFANNFSDLLLKS